MLAVDGFFSRKRIIEDKQIIAHLENKTPNYVIKRLCGPMIGAGTYIDVYPLKKFPNHVVKFERDMTKGDFTNVCEWRNYVNYNMWNFLRPWLAPCVTINRTGDLMVQHRLFWDGKKRKDYPTHVPGMFTDLKLRNFGWNKDGQFMCCDYSFMNIFPVQAGKNGMRYAKWRGWNH